MMINHTTFSFTKIQLILVFLFLFGCGNTPIKPTNSIEIINQNSAKLIVNEFKFKKLQREADFDQLPKGLASDKNQMRQFDFYFVQSPTQGSGGFIFEVVQNSDSLIICLRKPSPFAMVATVLSNPIALVKVKKDLIVEKKLGYCT